MLEGDPHSNFNFQQKSETGLGCDPNSHSFFKKKLTHNGIGFGRDPNSNLNNKKTNTKSGLYVTHIRIQLFKNKNEIGRGCDSISKFIFQKNTHNKNEFGLEGDRNSNSNLQTKRNRTWR